MKDGANLNPLVNPVIPGDAVKVGGIVYEAKTDMKGKWRVYHDGELIAQDIGSQSDLCAWFSNVAAARTLW